MMYADNEKVKGLPQIEFGTKITSPINQPTFIFAFLWPLRLYAAKASDYSNLVVHVEDEKPGMKEMVKVGIPIGGHLVGCSCWKTRLQDEQVRQNATEHVLVLFQGLRDALNRVLDFLRSLKEGSQRVEIVAFLTSETSGTRSIKNRQ